MKKIKFLFTVMAVFFMSQVVSAQTSEWKEKTEFHKIMSQTFHPAEEGNLEPIKLRSEEMVQKATALSIERETFEKEELARSNKALYSILTKI